MQQRPREHVREPSDPAGGRNNKEDIVTIVVAAVAARLESQDGAAGEGESDLVAAVRVDDALGLAC